MDKNQRQLLAAGIIAISLGYQHYKINKTARDLDRFAQATTNYVMAHNQMLVDNAFRNIVRNYDE